MKHLITILNWKFPISILHPWQLVLTPKPCPIQLGYSLHWVTSKISPKKILIPIQSVAKPEIYKSGPTTIPSFKTRILSLRSGTHGPTPGLIDHPSPIQKQEPILNHPLTLRIPFHTKEYSSTRGSHSKKEWFLKYLTLKSLVHRFSPLLTNFQLNLD